MTDLDRRAHLQELRRQELLAIAELVPARARILEIGAGSGWQSSLLAGLGHAVHAIDLEAERHEDRRHVAVAAYDGHHLPFPARHFDVIFSSNVLEHIAHLEAFQREMQRVLRTSGIAIHVVPTTAWRWWTSLTHYAYVTRLAFDVIRRSLGRARPENDGAKPAISRKLRANWRKLMWPGRHGETGNAFTELRQFSAGCWKTRFEQAGWTVLDHRDLGLFYTGNQVLHRHLSLPWRRTLARALGSATQVFLLSAAASEPQVSP